MSETIQVPSKADISLKMQEVARDLLEKQTVDLVIGWEKGLLPNMSTPTFISDVNRVDSLVFDEYCYQNLTKFLLDYRNTGSDAKKAIFVKGCDSRSLVGLIQDNQIKRDDVVIIGIDCPGLKEKHDKTIDARKCETCYTATPVEYDFLIQSSDTKPEPADGIKGPKAHRELQKVSAMSLDERDEYWQEMFSSCIRCYACRNVCPVCSCKECCFDQTTPRWLSKSSTPSDNSFYHITRAMHVAGRCVACGECERVCPQHLPVMLLNSKLSLSIEELFDEQPASISLDTSATLTHFEPDDPEEFM